MKDDEGHVDEEPEVRQQFILRLKSEVGEENFTWKFSEVWTKKHCNSEKKYSDFFENDKI